MQASEFRSGCPIASALDILGDRWTLLVIRNLALGARSYGDFRKAPEQIATNILADRLARLERCGLIEAAPARSGARGGYRLTRAGAELLPVLQALGRWAGEHLPNRWAPPDGFMEATPDDLLARG
ncbi:helix-turn-helix domain-containing protein [Phenylobacterium sp.]|jgi:DNA-binding HxlR family transcriptional regulator|uniref:winged helix-turn-helix transcriptional regulator n=1 Tax=Phenylobacterium sp. TaxID=1871053 RepID=UPI002F93469A